ncbi:PF14063 domain protein [Bacteriovorax sp. BSW11_IV]|uniref:hypothetical protein n=1 Tax=Bacteriovorax sp. BSW11_IV TaxID=1353529 RepID=UPI00038A2469|nr:hypothetical protein [Bacteriovorax sp. BSW11_IV]EQC50116.1 PF14063 domain protein [Bacteriovorax sp. BSW11_IV]
MEVSCPVSLGELVDKISILRIKKVNIADKIKLEAVFREEKLLSEILISLSLSEIDNYLEKLVEINSRLWKIEDDIREKERSKQFDEQFIELARLVYITNDQRFAVKNDINQKFGSAVKEVKSYEEY